MEPVIAQSLSIASFEVAMKKFVPYFLIVFLTFSLLGAYQSARAGGAVWHVLAPKANKVDSSVQVILDNSAPGDMLTVIVMLDKQADLSRVKFDSGSFDRTAQHVPFSRSGRELYPFMGVQRFFCDSYCRSDQYTCPGS